MSLLLICNLVKDRMRILLIHVDDHLDDSNLARLPILRCKPANPEK